MSGLVAKPRIFITGVTGYIAGDAFYALSKAHPDYEYTLLIRSIEKAQSISKAYPGARIMVGSLDDSKLLEEESAHADIVIHAADASDHAGAARAIANGISNGHSRGLPGFWIHTSGTGILTYFDSKDERHGEASTKVFNDLEGVGELINLPDKAFHRDIDKIVLEAGAGNPGAVNTAIVCPPTIYGPSRGPLPTRGRQAYELARTVLTENSAPIIGRGLTRWNNIHVQDLSRLYVLLVENAVTIIRNHSPINPAIWGPQGYFLAENGEHLWSELSRKMAEYAKRQRYINNSYDLSLNKDQAFKIAGFEALSWGLNSRATARRANAYLGWRPVERSIWDEVPAIVEAERTRLMGVNNGALRR